MSSTKFVFFWSIEKKIKIATRSLIGWDIFDFSETAERIQRNLTESKISTSSTNFVGFFSGKSENQDGRMASDW